MPKKEVNITWMLSDIHRNHVRLKHTLDTKANWILGVSGLLLMLSINNLSKGYGYQIIFFSAFLSFLLSLIAFNPLNLFIKQKHNPISMMYYESFKDMSPEEIVERLKQIKTKDDLIEQYAWDLYNLVNRVLKFKSRLIKWPVYILLVGVIIGFVLIFLGI